MNTEYILFIGNRSYKTYKQLNRKSAKNTSCKSSNLDFFYTLRLIGDNVVY